MIYEGKISDFNQILIKNKYYFYNFKPSFKMYERLKFESDFALSLDFAVGANQLSFNYRPDLKLNLDFNSDLAIGVIGHKRSKLCYYSLEQRS